MTDKWHHCKSRSRTSRTANQTG